VPHADLVAGLDRTLREQPLLAIPLLFGTQDIAGVLRRVIAR
jgi:hypothetical protein